MWRTTNTHRSVWPLLLKGSGHQFNSHQRWGGPRQSRSAGEDSKQAGRRFWAFLPEVGPFFSPSHDWSFVWDSLQHEKPNRFRDIYCTLYSIYYNRFSFNTNTNVGTLGLPTCFWHTVAAGKLVRGGGTERSQFAESHKRRKWPKMSRSSLRTELNS